MTFADNTLPSQNEFIAFEFDLAHSPKKVLARAHRARAPRAVAPARHCSAGRQVRAGGGLHVKALPAGGWGAIVNCQFVAIEAGRTIIWRWVVGDIDTLVTFTLGSTPTGTRLSLVQRGFKLQQKQNWGGACDAWKVMGGKLVALLARIQ